MKHLIAAAWLLQVTTLIPFQAPFGQGYAANTPGQAPTIVTPLTPPQLGYRAIGPNGGRAVLPAPLLSPEPNPPWILPAPAPQGWADRKSVV